MTLATPRVQSVSGQTRLTDFEIRQGADIGPCNGAQSFRAIRRSDGMPVLLHKFRPARSLLDLRPIIEHRHAPDFTKPFVTRFTDLFSAAGSVYLVEPLPFCFSLPEVWRCVLVTRPHQAVSLAAVLVHQLLLIVRQLIAHGKSHGSIRVENIVLTPAGNFGVLAASIRCHRSVLWLRKDTDQSRRNDFYAVGSVLRSLIEMKTELASAAPARSLLLSQEETSQPPACAHSRSQH
jgi:hypothetical protein